MIQQFIAARKNRFHTWWKLPPTKRERAGAAAVGAWVCLWLGVIAGFVFAPHHSLSMSALGLCAAGGAFGGAILGAALPKWVLCIASPFAFFSIGGSN